MEKQTKELRIQGNSDESVGIYSDEIIIKSRFGNALQFDTKEDFNNFKSKLKEAFEYCMDSPSIETIEEINLREQEQYIILSKFDARFEY